MPQNLLRTKFLLPRLRKTNFSRESLNQRLLTGLAVPLTIIQAGPGFGKSLLLSDFCQSGSSPVAWLSLSETDRDVYTFLLHLVFALKERKLISGERTIPVVETVRATPSNWSNCFH